MVGLKEELGVHTRSANQDQSVPESPDAPKHNAHDETDHCGCVQLETNKESLAQYSIFFFFVMSEQLSTKMSAYLPVLLSNRVKIGGSD